MTSPTDDDHRPSLRVSTAPLWTALTAAVGTALVVVFARRWMQVFDRPWFPLLIALSLVATVATARWFAHRWWRVELVDGPAVRLRRLTGGARVVPLDGLAEVVIADRRMHGRSADGLRVVNRRRDLVLRCGDRSFGIAAPGRGSVAEQFAHEVSGGLLDTEPRRETGRGARLAPTVGVGATEWLVLDAGGGSSNGVLKVVAAVTGWMLLLGAGAIALVNGPTYEYPSTDPARVSEQVAATLADLDLAPSRAEVDVSRDDQPCTREEAWLWGGPDGMAKLVVVAEVPLDPGEHDAARQRLVDAGGRVASERSGYLSPGLGGPTKVTIDTALTVQVSTGCMNERDRQEAAVTVESAASRLADRLAGNLT